MVNYREKTKRLLKAIRDWQQGFEVSQWDYERQEFVPSGPTPSWSIEHRYKTQHPKYGKPLSQLERTLLIDVFKDDEFGEERKALTYAHINKMTSVPAYGLRRTTRALARKGYIEHVPAFSMDDCMVVGSGYCLTKLGFDTLSEMRVKEEIK